MSRLSIITRQRTQRRQRVRSTVIGTSERPRLSVNISNRHIVAQLIDDSKNKTIAYATSIGSKDTKQTMTDRAIKIGGEIAAAGTKAKVKLVVFDRGDRLYHGRIKALADAARKGGLEF